LEGNIFTNAYYGMVADTLAYAAGGWLYQKLGMRTTFAVSYILSFIGGLAISLI